MTKFRYQGNGRFTYSFDGEVHKATRGMEFEVMDSDAELFKSYNNLVEVRNEQPKIEPKVKPKPKKEAEEQEEDK